MNTVSFEQESNPWLAQAARLELAAQKLLGTRTSYNDLGNAFAAQTRGT
jgi:hypothetical protein